MARAATSRLKVNPPLGLRPSLENCRLGDLKVDAAYQRSIDNASSKALIRKIAMHWDWALFHPLAVARRADGSLWVVDGQHRLEAARARRDLYDLPCVVSSYDSRADEAASFVAMNVQRRALSKIDLFKAAVAAGDQEATGIVSAIEAAGLSVAPHQNYVSWKPGMVSNIGGIEASWRRHSEDVTRLALRVLADAWRGSVLRYAGSLFPGIAAVVADEYGRFVVDDEFRVMLVEMIGAVTQEDWRGEIMRKRADDPNLRFAAASEVVLREAWAELLAEFMDEAA
ncbi:DUF6551 family protein [Croceicoccus sp. BE223]|uniref:DUF6551 family protein n=1 Tax=Croceicoccus sp. BE223 TaxID=2817716 RepID=UPI00285C0CDE|nr:DUF6551 family protein [Croceicoccus sp. BE223]MDR7101502.1 hypothetical protein [Croceicoccus sp. BE223]